MKILIFDTETTGLPNKKESDLEKQPRVVQFAGIIGDLSPDGTWKKEEEINRLINPGINIPHQVSEIHGIYNVDVKDKPNMDEMLPKILEKINSVDFVVAHNLEFDETLIQLEVRRLQIKGLPYDYLPKGKICTMKTSLGLCKLPKPSGYPGYKNPKLQELFYFLFNKYFKGAHDALVDVKACGVCLVEMVKIKHIDLIKVEEKQVNLF